MTAMRILGIDPGTNLLGFAILEVAQKNLSVIKMGVFRLKGIVEAEERWRQIFLRTQNLIDLYKPTEMAIESPFYGKNVQSMLKLGRAQGIAIAAALAKEINFTEYSPKKVKVAITGNGNAAKEQVAAMLPHLVQTSVDVDNLDATDALAVAICHHFQQTGFSGSRKHYKDWSAFLKDNPERKK